MKTVSVSKQAKGINAILKQACKENLIIKFPDGCEFILAEIDDFNREIALARQNKQLMKFLDLRARQTKTIPLKEAKVQLGLEK